MIRKSKPSDYSVYAIKINSITNKRRNLGTFINLNEAKSHERQILHFKALHH
jgi:hypothetical protein